jgi:antitoxin CcdA
MRHIDKKSKKKVISITIDEDILREARELGMNMSQLTEKAVLQNLRLVKEEQWIKNNQKAIAAHNRRIEQQGLLIRPYWMDNH